MRTLRLILYLLLLCLIGCLLACSKDKGIIDTVKTYKATLYSDKYTYDSVYLFTDTLWSSSELDKENYDKVVGMPPSVWISWIECPDPTHFFRLEHRIYILGDNTHKPVILKP